jgi:hypothetical protein
LYAENNGKIFANIRKQLSRCDTKLQCKREKNKEEESGEAEEMYGLDGK